MLVKELKEKYKDYEIELYGKSLKARTTPFSYLPIGNLDNWFVKETEIIEKEHDIFTFDNTFNFKKKEIIKGYVRAYIVEKEVRDNYY